MAANSSSPPPVLPVEEAVEHAAETGHVPNNTAAEVDILLAALDSVPAVFGLEVAS